MNRASCVLIVLAVIASDLAAQSSRDPRRTGQRPLLDRADEILLARSAAPASVSDSASVFVFTDTGYVLAQAGKNDAACYVSRSWPDAIEPQCFDAEGAATIMRIHMREIELLHSGLTLIEAERELATAIMDGTYRLPRRPAMSWMFSAGQKLISDTGQPAGNWRPHIMIYFPFLGEAVAQDISAGIISDAGTATSSIVIPVADFVPVGSR